MQNYIGVLGDPAKYELYSDEFYQILEYDESRSTFQLLGASENDVSKGQYSRMFNKFHQHLGDLSLSRINGLSGTKSTSYYTRIGLFPSSTSHLISGPSFSFAPFPINSASRFLQFKSNFLRFVLRPFLPFSIRKLAYVPLGGKAASKTKADTELSHDKLPPLFSRLKSENKFDWYYLEAGSGEQFLPYEVIHNVLHSQIPSSIHLENISQDLDPGSRLIIPRFIYGGGIRSIDQLDQLLLPKTGEVKLIPEVIIIGNISEDDISMTFDLVSRVAELNEITTTSLNNYR